MLRIEFQGSDKSITIREGKSILDAARDAGVALNDFCAGRGSCGKCKVKVLTGRTNPLTETEIRHLTDKEREEDVRLACETYPLSNLEIEPFLQGEMQSLKTHPVQLPTWFRKTLDKETQKQGYGIAFDLGTTTVAGILWNMETRESVGALSRTNPQVSYGADVISRITYIGQDSGRLEELRAAVTNCMNEIITELCERESISLNALTRCTVCGNTTMSHIFAGALPYDLAVAPFTPSYTGAKMFRAKDAGLRLAEDAEVYLLPGIAGHVGSDITADLLAGGLLGGSAEEGCQTVLLIDIGTNGEIVLRRADQIYVCSTAAGPAFEGAGLRCGMRAADGAIQSVMLEEDGLHISTIGEKPPVGICGSGIIDAVAQMLEYGLLDETGRIRSAEELDIWGVSPAITAWVRSSGRVNELVLYEDGAREIVITQKDIREIQLAKAAVAAGTKVLLQSAGIRETDLDALIVAGAFGSHINTTHAMRMGLLPEVPEHCIHVAGNAASLGASMMLWEHPGRKELEEAVRDISHVELAGRADFEQTYIDEMGFQQKP